jgi:hypothetical protein
MIGCDWHTFKEFIVNKYVKLRLVGKETIIYVGNKEFRKCKFLLLNIPFKDFGTFDEIDSIDKIAKRLDKSLETDSIKIPPKVEFWGHCSNLQIWAEFGYDSRLLHSNLAFPLLKELVKYGDRQAKEVFKNEIFKRFTSGFSTTQLYLIEEKYLDYLTDEERETLFNASTFDINIKKLIRYYKRDVNLLIYYSRNNRQPNAISYICFNKFGIKVYYGCVFIYEVFIGFKFFQTSEGNITNFFIVYDGNRIYNDKNTASFYSLETHQFLKYRSFDYFALTRCEKVLTNYFELIPTEDKYDSSYKLNLDILEIVYQIFVDIEGNKNYILKINNFDFNVIEYLRQSKFLKKNYFDSDYGKNLKNLFKYYKKFSQ